MIAASAGDGSSERQRTALPPSTRNIVVRAVLTATSFVIAVYPGIVATGAFLPGTPVVGRFGVLVVPHLPYILNGAVGALLLAILALRLGGGRFNRGLVWLTSSITIALLVVTLWMTAFATKHGVAFSLFRQAMTPAEAPLADQRMVFATVEGVDLHVDVWRARTSDATPATGDVAPGAPAGLYVHGGAFVSGHLGSRALLFDELARAGIAVIDVEYRLAAPPRWRDAPGDVLCALGWTTANAEPLGIDPSRIVVAGESAGGSLALLAAFGAGTDQVVSSCDLPAVKPAGVFAIAPAADLEGIWSDRSIYALDRPFPEAYVGGSPADVPERYAYASPFRLLRADLPPTFLLTGANDQFVYPGRVTALGERIQAAGADCEVVVAPFADHGFDGAPNGYGAQLEGVLLRRFVARVTG